MNKIAMSFLLSSSVLLSNAQVIKNNRNSDITLANTKTRQTALVNNIIDPFSSSLHFAYQTNSDPDCKGPQCYHWEYLTSVWRDANSNTSSWNWKENVVWRHIPAGTAFGKYEISLSPYTGNNEIIQSGLVKTDGKDSVLFTINYTDPLNARAVGKPREQKKIKNASGQPIKLSNTNNVLLSAIKDVPSNKKFFIHISLLDSRQNPMKKFSNEISLIQTWANIPKPKNEPTIVNDYTITSVEYVPVHFPDPAFYGCTIVTGYNESYFANSPYGKDFAEAFKNAFPIGTTICPTPPKEKDWYEKAFDGVSGFMVKTIDGAANFYNDTKNYIKGKFADAFCSDNVIKNLAAGSAASGAKQTPDGICQKVAGYAFDGAMVAAGIPPSLPNTDDLTKMAEGQIVDITCDKMEEASGIPLPQELRDKMKEEFHNTVVSSSSNRMVDCGFLKVKPHPSGFFQTAYIKIEITRTGNSFKNKAIAGIGISNKATRSNIYCESCNTDQNDHTLSFDLFERAFTEIPFLHNIGDKTKVILVLKPMESWIHKNPATGKYNHIEKAHPVNEWVNTVPPTYEGAASSPGFNTLCTQSVIRFDFGGMKIANGVQTSFSHK